MGNIETKTRKGSFIVPIFRMSKSITVIAALLLFNSQVISMGFARPASIQLDEPIESRALIQTFEEAKSKSNSQDTSVAPSSDSLTPSPVLSAAKVEKKQFKKDPVALALQSYYGEDNVPENIRIERNRKKPYEINVFITELQNSVIRDVGKVVIMTYGGQYHISQVVDLKTGTQAQFNYTAGYVLSSIWRTTCSDVNCQGGYWRSQMNQIVFDPATGRGTANVTSVLSPSWLVWSDSSLVSFTSLSDLLKQSTNMDIPAVVANTLSLLKKGMGNLVFHYSYTATGHRVVVTNPGAATGELSRMEFVVKRDGSIDVSSLQANYQGVSSISADLLFTTLHQQPVGANDLQALVNMTRLTVFSEMGDSIHFKMEGRDYKIHVDAFRNVFLGVIHTQYDWSQLPLLEAPGGTMVFPATVKSYDQNGHLFLELEFSKTKQISNMTVYGSASPIQIPATVVVYEPGQTDPMAAMRYDRQGALLGSTIYSQMPSGWTPFWQLSQDQKDYIATAMHELSRIANQYQGNDPEMQFMKTVFSDSYWQWTVFLTPDRGSGSGDGGAGEGHSGGIGIDQSSLAWAMQTGAPGWSIFLKTIVHEYVHHYHITALAGGYPGIQEENVTRVETEKFFGVNGGPSTSVYVYNTVARNYTKHRLINYETDIDQLKAMLSQDPLNYCVFLAYIPTNEAGQVFLDKEGMVVRFVNPAYVSMPQRFESEIIIDQLTDLLPSQAPWPDRVTAIQNTIAFVRTTQLDLLDFLQTQLGWKNLMYRSGQSATLNRLGKDVNGYIVTFQKQDQTNVSVFVDLSGEWIYYDGLWYQWLVSGSQATIKRYDPIGRLALVKQYNNGTIIWTQQYYYTGTNTTPDYSKRTYVNGNVEYYDSTEQLFANVNALLDRNQITEQQFNEMKSRAVSLWPDSPLFGNQTYQQFIAETLSQSYAPYIEATFELGLSADRERFIGLIRSVEHLVFLPNLFDLAPNRFIAPSFADGSVHAIVTTFPFDAVSLQRLAMDMATAEHYFLGILAHEAKHLSDEIERPDLFAHARWAEIEYRAWAEDFYFSKEYIHHHDPTGCNYRAFIIDHGPDNDFQGPVGKIFADYDMNDNQATWNAAVAPLNSAIEFLATKTGFPAKNFEYISSTSANHDRFGTNVQGYDIVFSRGGTQYQIFVDLSGEWIYYNAQWIPQIDRIVMRLLDRTSISSKQYQSMIEQNLSFFGQEELPGTYEAFQAEEISAEQVSQLERVLDRIYQLDPYYFVEMLGVLEHVIFTSFEPWNHGAIVYPQTHTVVLNELTYATAAPEEKDRIVLTGLVHEVTHISDLEPYPDPTLHQIRVSEANAYAAFAYWNRLLGNMAQSNVDQFIADHIPDNNYNGVMAQAFSDNHMLIGQALAPLGTALDFLQQTGLTNLKYVSSPTATLSKFGTNLDGYTFTFQDPATNKMISLFVDRIGEWIYYNGQWYQRPNG